MMSADLQNPANPADPATSDSAVAGVSAPARAASRAMPPRGAEGRARGPEAGGSTPRKVIRYVVLTVLALIFVSPLIFMLVTSFKTRADAGGIPPSWIPNPFSTQAYESILAAEGTPVLRWFANSMIAAVSNAALVVASSAMAAYALARMEFKGRGIVFGAIIATLFVPPVILIIPNYLIVGQLGWLNTLVAVIVPTAASAFGVFFLRQFFISLPAELEEAARLDGANQWQTFLKIALPLSRPALATLALLSLLTNWNDFLWPVYVLFGPEAQTLPAGLSTLQSANAVRYDLLMAGAVIASAPMIVLFIFLQRFIIEGVSRSGLKG
ncbi:MAG: carbohydrate transporter permease [Actinotalea sp.]|nr:carbohydrate transporter permease [Actinotalea sp.]